MKNIRRTATLAFLSAFFLTSCAPEKTRLEIRFSSLFGETPSRTPSGFDSNAPAPAVPATGFVYIQTSYDSSAAILGPYQVKPGDSLVCSDLPPGQYNRLVLYYSPEPVFLPPVNASDDRDFWSRMNTSAIASGTFKDSGAASLFGDIAIGGKGRKIIQATLIPFTNLVFKADSPEVPVSAETAGRIRKQFIRIEGGASESLYVMLSMYNGEGITYAGTLSLYNVAGGLLDSKALNTPITEDLPSSVLFALPPGAPAYLYIEYSAKGNRPFGLSFF